MDSYNNNYYYKIISLSLIPLQAFLNTMTCNAIIKRIHACKRAYMISTRIGYAMQTIALHGDKLGWLYPDVIYHFSIYMHIEAYT